MIFLEVERIDLDPMPKKHLDVLKTVAHFINMFLGVDILYSFQPYSIVLCIVEGREGEDGCGFN